MGFSGGGHFLALLMSLGLEDSSGFVPFWACLEPQGSARDGSAR